MANINRYFLFFITLSFLFSGMVEAKELKTNAIHMEDAPDWVTAGRLNKIVDHIQSLLEWDIRRIEVYWYDDQDKFEAIHHYGPTVLAISRKSDNTVHIGPRVNSENFDKVFGHELVHIISFQKYKEAIPAWLEEGLANYLSKQGTVDYKWLASQPTPDDVRTLLHPFLGSVDHIRYHYMASQALTEMIASKCDLSNLLRLSVGRKMENYLETYCGIKDLTAEFKKWVKAHS
jgi:hypothetical protein